MPTTTPESQPSEMPGDRAAIAADDALLDQLATAHRMGDDTEETFRLLAKHRRQVLAGPDPELVDTDTALAAMQVNVGTPLVAGVTLLTVMVMIGATLGVILAYLVTGLFSALAWGLGLGAVALAVAVGVVMYRERRR